MREVALTTFDNPFDPFDEFESWFHFDESKGYHTSGMIGRVSESSDQLSDADQLAVIEEAIDFLLEIHDNSVFKKVVRQL